MTELPRQLRVLLFTDADVFAGTERHILDLANGLRAQGMEVAAACPELSILGQHLSRHGIEHVVIQKRGVWDRAAIRSLRNLLTSGRFDIVHAHNGRTTLLAALAVRSARRGKCISTQHFITPNHATHRGLKRFIFGIVHHCINRQVHAHIAISEAVRQAAVARGEITAGQIHLVHNGIADPALSTLRATDEVRNDFSVPQGSTLIVCTARLEMEKGIEYLLRAMAFVMRSEPGAICIIAGDGARRADLERLAKELSINHAVRFPGFVSDALSLVNAADIFVLPSIAEPFGLAVVEAMALSKPVVATRAGGPMEIVVENQTGLLTTPTDATSLGASLLHLISNHSERIAMGIAGRLRFESYFTQARMAREMIAVYRSVVE